jgi:stalled ribosome rescue protein Dom34
MSRVNKEHTMTTKAGVWIDHRKAVIVVVSKEGETTRQVESNVAGHVRYSGGAHAGESRESRPGTAEDTRERHFEGQLDKYYDEVITCMRTAKAILIMGPGEAKGELKARLEHGGFGARIVGVETVDKMTDLQITAAVRARFPS